MAEPKLVTVKIHSVTSCQSLSTICSNSWDWFVLWFCWVVCTSWWSVEKLKSDKFFFILCNSPSTVVQVMEAWIENELWAKHLLSQFTCICQIIPTTCLNFPCSWQLHGKLLPCTYIIFDNLSNLKKKLPCFLVQIPQECWSKICTNTTFFFLSSLFLS